MEFNKEQILAFIPLVVIHLGLMIYALKKIVKSGRTKLFPKAAWIVLIICVNIFGSLAYLLLGRTYETD